MTYFGTMSSFHLSTPRWTHCRIVIVFLLISLFLILFNAGMVDWVLMGSREIKSVEQHAPPIAVRASRSVLKKDVLQSKISKCRSNTRGVLLRTIKYLENENAKLNERAKQYELEMAQKVQRAAQPANCFGDEDDVATESTRGFNMLPGIDTSVYNTTYPGIENHTRYVVNQLGLLPLTDVDALVPGFGPVINDVLSFRYAMSIPPCREFSDGRRTVFMAVISAADNAKKRDVIRRTWKTHLKTAEERGTIGIAGFSFVLGLSEDNEMQSHIEEENGIHRDIIQVEMPDVYRSLPRKGAGLLNWLHANCLKVDFVLKVDDDAYVNVHNLVHFVRAYHQAYHSVFGFGHLNTAVVREKSVKPEYAKWAVTFEEYPWSTYPDYVMGLAYLLHGSTIRLLLAACQTTPMVPFEDVYLTGMCAEKAGVKKYVSIGPSSVCNDLQYSVPTACEMRKYIAWPSDNLLESHTAFDNFYSLNRTHCGTISSDGIYIPVDPKERVHFHFRQTNKILS